MSTLQTIQSAGRLLSVDELSRALNIRPASIRRLARIGELRSTKIGRQLRFEPADVAEFLATNTK